MAVRSSTGAERAELVAEQWLYDPLLWARDLLGVALFGWQARVLEAFHGGARRVAVKAPRGAGKTTVAAVAAWHFLCNHPDTLTVVITPTARQARHGCMSEMKRIWDASPKLRALFRGFEVFDFEIRTPRPTWRLVAYSAGDDLDAIEGLHGPEGCLLVADEARALPDEAWTRLQPMLRGPQSGALVVSTPGQRQGFFYDAFLNGSREAFDETLSITLEDCPHLSDLAKREAKRLGEANVLFRQQFEAEFADVEDAPLFPIPLLERCRRDPDGELEEDSLASFIKSPPRQRIGGFDPAGGGVNGDDSAMALIVGRCVKRIRVLPKLLEPMGLVAEALRQAREWQITTLNVDAGGLGLPIASRMRESAPRYLTIRNFIAGGKPFEGSGANFKTSVALRLRELLLEGEFGFDLPDADFARLARELSSMSLTAEFKSGRVRCADPSRSPDVADALIVGVSSYVNQRMSVMAAHLEWL